MIIVTTETIPGKKIVGQLGLVRGNSVRVRHIGRDIIAGLKTIIGGEVAEYTKMLAETREQALDRMIEEAIKKGANAVVNVRFSTSFIMKAAAELLAYGTAVKIENDTD
ncbi:MAG: YbjQ family protein [Candidatus Zixiibacteriota bacterium]|nr:MAG: YbjQ family protein [candidate division Zixibacteria bacterium]